jgi:hypothetical protein
LFKYQIAPSIEDIKDKIPEQPKITTPALSEVPVVGAPTTTTLAPVVPAPTTTTLAPALTEVPVVGAPTTTTLAPVVPAPLA